MSPRRSAGVIAGSVGTSRGLGAPIYRSDRARPVYLALGKIHVVAKEIPKARNMFERGLENDPKNEELRKALQNLPPN